MLERREKTADEGVFRERWTRGYTQSEEHPKLWKRSLSMFLLHPSPLSLSLSLRPPSLCVSHSSALFKVSRVLLFLPRGVSDESWAVEITSREGYAPKILTIKTNSLRRKKRRNKVEGGKTTEEKKRTKRSQ